MQQISTYGWYDYTDDKGSMVNRITGQSLIFESCLELDANVMNLGSWSERASLPPVKLKLDAARIPKIYRYRYRYKDSEVDMPVVFEKAQGVLLDYHDMFLMVPTYGLWRRLDDFLTDALQCWLPGADESMRVILYVNGGYRQGVWDSTFRRRYLERNKLHLSDMSKGNICEPYVSSLGRPTPSKWLYNDYAPPHQLPKLPVFLDDGFDVNFLGQESILPHIEGKVPYLSRTDGKAFIFPSGSHLVPRRGHGSISRVYYTYVDEELCFVFGTNNIYEIEPRYVKLYVFRQQPPERHFFATNVYGLIEDRSYRSPMSAGSYLNYRVWLDFTHVLLDAWPMWNRSSKVSRELIWPELVERQEAGAPRIYAGDFGKAIHGGFKAGHSHSFYNLKYSLESIRRGI